ncbi:MAG: Gfo/Idh/MocA family oxidoreductase [Armatimonadetes bacterium]|nr:Gfo/Idh/MocA family oxidoreductase [Armatimonadota bacterium]
MTQLTTAFLGVAHIHTPGFIGTLNKRANEIRVKAVHDHQEERGRRRAGEMPGAQFVADPQDIFDDPEITSVVICAETVRHRDLVTRAARAGKHLFVEKPLGLGAEDSRAMADAIRAAGVTFQTGFAMRSGGVSRFITREVQAGHLGRITRVRYSNCHQAALAGWFDTEWRWLTDPKLAGGGAFLDLGAHVLDQIVHIFPKTEGEVTHVAASLGNRGGRYGTQIDEYGTGLLTFASGASAVLEASWIDPQLRSPLEVFGTEGQIQVKDGGLFYYSQHVEGMDGKTPVTGLSPQAPHAFDQFWDALLGRELPVPLVPVEEAAQGSALMERLYHAAGRSTTTGLE